MSYIFDQIPYFKCLVRREYLRNLGDGKGEYHPAIAVGVRCQRGLSLYFQVWFTDEDNSLAGAMFLLPIEALCWKQCPPEPTRRVQPWDVFSAHFTVTRLDLFHRSRAWVLEKGRGNKLLRFGGRYLFTVDFVGSDLAEDLEQHKHLHVVKMDQGWFGAFPNNRLLIEDTAFARATTTRPPFKTLEREFYAE